MPAFIIDALTVPVLFAGMSALVITILLVSTQRLHGHFSMDVEPGIQKFHSDPTPRIGGLAVAIGAWLGYFIAPDHFYHELMWPLLLASTPAFVFGLAEDITKRVSVTARLLATMGSGLLGWAITGNAIGDVNVPGVDSMLSITMVSVLFTAFAVGGVANAINIIDGFNGLAGGTIIIVLCAFAAISHQVGDADLAHICITLAFATLGFLLLNWPWGKIFLGDGGAYFLGFAVGWLAVLMLERHPNIPAWAPMLACGYPLLEVGFSMWRRKRRRLSLGAPDRLHLHSLVKRRLIRRLLPNATNATRNSATGAALWLAALLPALLATQFWQNAAALQISFVGCAVLYGVVYIRLTQFKWCLYPRSNTKQHP